jgi:hypothetical protein
MRQGQETAVRNMSGERGKEENGGIEGLVSWRCRAAGVGHSRFARPTDECW